MKGMNLEEKDELLILVDQDDKQIGLQDKLSVHKTGALHRAFSVFIFNIDGLLLLQQRALTKYHSPGLWSNTCCSHPRQHETVLAACQRRLEEEMGMDAELNFAFSFVYQADFANGLKEHEFDHVYLGHSDTLPLINKYEVMDWKYISVEDLIADIALDPGAYTEWLKICLPQVVEYLYRKKS